MHRLTLFHTTAAIACLLTMVTAAAAQTPQPINLADQLTAGNLRSVNREVSALEGSLDGVHVTEGAGPGVIWIDGADFSEGAIEVDVRGRDLFQRSFLGLAFHGTSDTAYEAVYTRPFNFRAEDPARSQHAVQYIAVPEYDWPRLRAEFPEEFENPVDASVPPTDWFHLRIVVAAERVQVYVGGVDAPALEVRKLGQSGGGMIGLWVGNNSDGDFAGLRVTAAR